MTLFEEIKGPGDGTPSPRGKRKGNNKPGPASKKGKERRKRKSVKTFDQSVVP